MNIKSKILIGVGLFIGVCWCIGGLIGIANSILTGIDVGDMAISLGGTMGAGFVFLLGILLLSWSIRKFKKEKQNNLEKYCSECKKSVPDDAKECPHCGDKFDNV